MASWRNETELITMDSNIQILKTSLIFSSLDEADLKKVCAITKEKFYKKNEVILRQGDPGNTLFILKSGQVKVHLNNKDGREIILKIIEGNDFFGEMSLLDGKFRAATITAMKDSKALLVFREDFIRLIKTHPSIAMNILASVIGRFRKANEKIASHVFFNSYGKVAEVLLDLMDKEGRCYGNYTMIDTHISRMEMAEMAGITRETFSRILKEFRLRGYLSIKGRKIIIYDDTMLRREII